MLALCVTFASGVVCSQAADDELTELRRFLATLETLEADFEQEVVNSEGELVELASGTVQLKKPGRFRWNYAEPYERIVVADGERVWVYESDLEQVTVRRLTAGLGETPAALLTGDTSALEQFEFVSAFTADAYNWITLRPKAADSDFAAISLGFGDGMLERLELKDRLGQSTRLLLSGIRRDQPIADEAFVFVVPENADVIGETEL